MEWKINFSESDKEIPCNILKKIINEFNRIANGQEELQLHSLIFSNKDIERYWSLNNYFKFKLTLTCPHLKDFSMKVLWYGYDVDLEKVDVILNDEIHKEIGNSWGETDGKKLIITNGTEFIEFLYAVFSSKKFCNTVSGLNTILRNKENP